MLIVCVQLHFRGRLQVVAGWEHGCNASSHGGHMRINNFHAKEKKSVRSLTSTPRLIMHTHVCVHLHFRGGPLVVAGWEHGCHASSCRTHESKQLLFKRQKFKICSEADMSTATLTPPWLKFHSWCMYKLCTNGQVWVSYVDPKLLGLITSQRVVMSSCKRF